jgi:hypothetical protein
MIILDIDIDDMYWSIQRGSSAEKIVDDSVPASFFTSNDHIHNPSFHAFAASVCTVLQPRHPNLPVLPSFWTPFDPSVPP